MLSELRARRGALPIGEKENIRLRVCDLTRENFPELRAACIGFYWPFKGEIDFRPLVCSLLSLGAEAALPVVTEKRQPLEFWSWRPRMKLQRGIWNIPIPGERCTVQPTVLLVPLVGFDRAGYRLGHGGGYYDRTLASLVQKPLSIGVGYDLGRLQTIHPQPHDIPMDAIVTERGVERFNSRDEGLNASGRSGEAATCKSEVEP
ncbi:MAG: 5-formyltetrahydrofolate cyclo-ligase [Terriglobales bacterium]